MSNIKKIVLCLMDNIPHNEVELTQLEQKLVDYAAWTILSKVDHEAFRQDYDKLNPENKAAWHKQFEVLLFTHAAQLEIVLEDQKAPDLQRPEPTAEDLAWYEQDQKEQAEERSKLEESMRQAKEAISSLLGDQGAALTALLGEMAPDTEVVEVMADGTHRPSTREELAKRLAEAGDDAQVTIDGQPAAQGVTTPKTMSQGLRLVSTNLHQPAVEPTIEPELKHFEERFNKPE